MPRHPAASDAAQFMLSERHMAQPEFYSGKTLYPFIAALIALSALFGLVIMPRLSPHSRFTGKPAPDFELPVVANGDANARMRLSQLRDKVVILDFWASWCGPCAQQAPILDRIARKYDRDVVVLGINIGEPPDLAANYARVKGISYPILGDFEGTAQELYQANALPTVVLIDKHGKVIALSQGVIRQAEIERTLKDLREQS
jgi:cytochrome c biogenesis protein CcmG, thiol:disulfide interchange protein DsbE